VKHTYNYMDYEQRDEQAAAFWEERRRRGLPIPRKKTNPTE